MLVGFGLWKWIQVTDRTGFTVSFGIQPHYYQRRWDFELLPSLSAWKTMVKESPDRGRDTLYGVEIKWLNITFFRIDVEILWR